jgi:hypothetical protein
MGDQLGGPGYTLLTNPSRGPQTDPSGEAGLSGAAADVTTAAWLAFLGRSMVRCSWSTTGRDRALRCPLRAGHRPRGPGFPARAWPGYDPGTMGTVPGVVAFSDGDAVPDGAGQGGGAASPSPPATLDPPPTPQVWRYRPPGAGEEHPPGDRELLWPGAMDPQQEGSTAPNRGPARLEDQQDRSLARMG